MKQKLSVLSTDENLLAFILEFWDILVSWPV